MSHADELARIGDQLKTYDGHARLFRTWKVLRYGWCAYLGRQVALVILVGEERIP